MKWMTEEIPDFLSKNTPSLLYYRIHNTFYSSRKGPSYKSPSAFIYSPIDHKMSTNWSKYSTAKQLREAGVKSPESHGVVSLLVHELRAEKELNNLSIEHAPLPKNRSHANINGLKEYEEISNEDYRHVQVLLARMAKWEIPFEEIEVD